MKKKYKMRVVRGAFLDPNKLDEFGAKTIGKLDRREWQRIEELILDLQQIKELQKYMIRHYDDMDVPWYMDGYRIGDTDDLIVAFGADDREGGKIFQFSRNDKKSFDEVLEYGIKKGIPKEQIDFMDIES